MRQPVSEKRKKVGLGGKGAGSEGTALVSSFGVLGNPNEVQIAFWGSTAYQPTLGRWKKSEQTVIVEEMGKVDRGPRLPPPKKTYGSDGVSDLLSVLEEQVGAWQHQLCVWEVAWVGGRGGNGWVFGPGAKVKPPTEKGSGWELERRA